MVCIISMVLNLNKSKILGVKLSTQIWRLVKVGNMLQQHAKRSKDFAASPLAGYGCKCFQICFHLYSLVSLSIFTIIKHFFLLPIRTSLLLSLICNSQLYLLFVSLALSANIKSNGSGVNILFDIKKIMCFKVSQL